MSAPEPTPLRASRLRLALRVLVSVGLGLAISAALGLVFLHSPAGLASARSFLESWGSAAAGGRLRLGGLELALWNGHAAATAVTLELPGTRVEAQRVAVDWHAGGARVALVRLRVVVTELGELERPRSPAGGLLAQPWRVLERVSSVEIEESRVELRDAKGAPWLLLAGLSASGRPQSGIELRVADMAVGWPGGGLRVKAASAEATLAVRDGRLQVERARLGAGRARLELAGSLERVLPLRGSTTGRASFDGALVEALAPGSGLSGEVEAEVALEVKDDRVSGTLAGSSRALELAGLGPWSAVGRGRIEDGELVLESVTAEGYGGRLAASGSLGLSPKAPTDVELRASGFDPLRLARALGRTQQAEMPRLSTLASGTLRYTTRGFDLEAARGAGQLTLEAGKGPGLELTGASGLRVLGRTLRLAGAHVEAGGARVTADVAIGPHAALDGRFAAELPLAALHGLLADLGHDAATPPIAGRLVADGSVQGSAGRPRLVARIRGDGLAVRGDRFDLEAEARYEDDRLSVAPLVLRSGSGRATLGGRVPLAASSEWDLSGELDALELGPALGLAELEGHGTATGTLRVTGARDAPVGGASLRGSLFLKHPKERGAAPAEDEVALTLEASSRGQAVEIERLRAELAGGSLEGTARYDASSKALALHAMAEGLAWERLPLLPASARALSGTLSGEAEVTGRATAPEGTLRIALAEPRLGGAALAPIRIEGRSDGTRLSVNGELGEATLLRGEAALDGDWPLRLELDAAALPLQALVDASPSGKAQRVTVAATGTIAVDVPLRDPSRLRYSTSSLALSGRVRRLDWRVPPLTLAGDLDSLRLGAVRVEAGKAWLAAKGEVPLAPKGAFDAVLEGELDLGSLAPGLPGRGLDGDGTVKLQMSGTLEKPDVRGELRVSGGKARVEGARASELELVARFVGSEVEIERLQASLLGGTLTANGRLPLLAGSSSASRLAFELKDVDLARLLDRELRDAADSPSLLVSLDGELRAEAPSLARVSARGRLTRLDSQSVEGALALAAPVAWSLERGELKVEPIQLKGPLGTLEARLTGDAGGTHPKGEAVFSGAVDLRALAPFLPDTSVSGPATVDVRATYADDAWRLFGSVKVEKGRLSLDSLNFAATDLAGELRFEGDHASLSASANASDGRLQAKGGMRLGRSLLGTADFELTAERVPLNYPAGFRGRASGSLRLTGEPGHYRVSGDVDVRQSFYTADLNAESQSLDRLDWQLGALDGGSLSDQIALAINVRLAEPLRVRNATMQVDLEGSLVVSGTLAQPTTEGVVNLREGGEMTIGRGRVRVSSGRLNLNGYPAGTPDLDLEGATSMSGIAFTLRARGAISDLQLTLDSDRNDLSQTDLVSLLLTGRTAAAAASQGGVVVAEQLAVALGGVLQKGVGDTLVIDVAPDRSLLTEDTDPTQRIHVGTRIKQNLIVLYSIALDGTQQRWIVELNPGGGRFRFRGITEEDNTFSVEGTDRFSFDLWNRGRRVGKAPREVERLASLRLEGTLPVPETELRKATKLKPGRRYSGLQREQAADRVRERLAKQGYRSASVDAVSQPGAGGVDLVLRVEAGPLVKLTWTGDDPGKKAKQAAEQAFTAFAAPEAAAVQVARTAVQRLQAEGYYGASVEPKTISAEGRVEVALHVTLGAKGTGVAVEFEGNKAIDDKALLAALPKPGSLAFFEALDPRSARISSSVRLAYAGIGYLRVRVPPPRSRFDAVSGRLSVTIRVRERTASKVAEIELPEEVRAPGAPPLAFKLEQGEPFDLAAYVADRDALVAWYRAQGWVEAQAGSTIETRGGSVSVHYLVDKGPRPRIGSVRVVDGGNTRSSLIRRSLTLREGDYLKPAALAESRERLADIGIYRSVDIRTEPRPPGDELRDVVVGLVPKPDVQIEYGLRYTTSGDTGAESSAPTTPSSSHFQASVAVELNSPFGYGVKTRGYTFLTTDRQSWGVNLDAPTLLGRRVRTQLFVFDDNEDDDFLLSGITSRVRGVTLQQSQVLLRDRSSRRWHDRLRLQWGYSFKNIEYFGSEPGVVQLQGYRGFLTLAAIGDERDSLTDPSRGIFWTATTELARTWLGSDADYVRLYGQLFAFVPIGPLVWAQGVRVGAVPGENALALLENRFRAGGSTTVRGFDQNDLGPKGPEGGSLGGQAVVVVNEELRFPIYKSLKGGLFWDAGNVWAFSRELDFKDLRQSVGFGLRYMFPFGPIRVEYAWIVNREPEEPKGRFVFGLGHAF